MLDESFWTGRYKNGETGWDIGYASPALMAYMKGKPLETRILIPGAGNAYEAEALWNKGYRRITVLDISNIPLDNLKKRLPGFPDEQLVCADFFGFTGSYDVILEQTFFCALPPALRPAYVDRMAELLAPGGELAGLLFDAPRHADKPPFGGSRAEYLALLSARLRVIEMETSAASIRPRAGKEVFFRASLR